MAATDSAQCVVRCGMGRADITPPVGIYHRMWGAATHDRATGVHRPLTATALLLEFGSQERELLVALDHCVLGSQEVQALKATLLENAKIAADSVTIVFSHTHAAGLMLHDRCNLPGGDMIADYLTNMNRAVAEMVNSAEDALQDATMIFGQGKCSLARNRDLWDGDRDQFVCGYNPQGSADDTLIVVKVLASDGQPIGSIVNYACHPTTLAWDNQLISPDFPGAMRELVENVTGAPCLFLQGASGDLGPKEGFTGDVEVANRNGRQLGYAALSVLESMPPPRQAFDYDGAVVSGATIGVWRHRDLTPEELASGKVLRRKRWQAPLAYRPELPAAEIVLEEREDWIEKERAANAVADELGARDAHAMVERKTRLLARVQTLPAGDHYPLEVTAWRTGDALWVFVQGEPYQQLQTELRRRFDDRIVLVGAIAGEWGPSYLPPRSAYGKGIYQETVAVMEAGSLEKLIEGIASQIGDLM